jgi:hypothetical protein
VAAPAGSPRSSRLGRLARGGATAAGPGAPPAAVQEHCELCGEPIAPEHRHLLDLETRELMCACQACKILFDRGAAGGGHYRLVPDRRLRLEDLELDDALWDGLRVPVDMAFFFHSSRAGRVLAFYPSPMGPTESQLTLSAWEELVARNPVLGTMAPDVEALLVDRVGGARRHWLVGVDECYALVGLIRTRWRGLSGGTEVWGAITEFFEALDRRSRPARRAESGTPTEEAPWQS